MPKRTRKNPNGNISKGFFEDLPLHKRSRKKPKKVKKKTLKPYKRGSPNRQDLENLT